MEGRSEKATKPARILIVDDEEKVAKATMRTLRKDGYSFSFARDGEEALRMYAEERFDLLISDRQMPRMGGLELVKRLMAKDPGAKIIVLSGGISKAETLEFECSGALSVMEKPFDSAELRKNVAAAVAGRRGGFAREEPAGEGIRKKTLNVLFVDDDKDIREAMMDVMPMLGHDIATAADGGEALKAISEGSFDIVVSDFHMLPMDGLEMLKRIKKDRPGLPVIMLFAAQGDDDIEMVMNAGASAVLSKPVDLDKLGKAISDACKG